MQRALTATRRFLETQHIEVVVAGIALVGACIYYGLIHTEVLGKIDTAFFRSLLYYLFFGWSFLKIAIVILYTYLILRVLHMWLAGIAQTFVSKGDPKYLTITSTHIRTAQSTFFIFLITFALLAVDVFITHDILRSEPGHVLSSSIMVMEMDRDIFGSYVAYTLSDLFVEDHWSQIFIDAYMSLGIALSIVFMLALFKNKTIFRQFLLSFLLIPLFSAPIWYAVSAVSPSETYRRNVFEVAHTPMEYVRTSPEFQLIHEDSEHFLEKIESLKSNKEKGVYADTAFPSMHVAWGMLAVYFGIRLWWPLALLLVPWQITNIIGAVFTLQHFAIDIFLGISVMVIVACLVNWLFEIEKKHQTHKKDRYMAIDTLQKDAHKMISFFIREFGVVRGYLRREKGDN